MATLTLNKTWINLFSTGAAVTGYRTGDDADSSEVQGRVATYAGGRQRGVTSEGVTQTWSFVLRNLTTADTETLRSWIGQTILIRDNRGRKTYGIILSVPRTPWKEQLDIYDVQVDLRSVSVVESV